MKRFMRGEHLACERSPSRSRSEGVAAAQRLEVHDNSAAHFGRMLGEERLDAAVVGKLGTKSNEPHLSVDIAGREGIDLLNLFSGFVLLSPSDAAWRSAASYAEANESDETEAPCDKG